MDFSALLSRCDAEVLQEILGKECMRLMGLMDSAMSSPAFARRLLTDAVGDNALLLDKRHRGRLLELLRPEEARGLCAVLDFEESLEPYTALKNLSVGRGSKRENALFTFFERVAPPVDATHENSSESECISSYPLFAHQRRAAREVSALLGTAPYRVLLHMPTGSGKTRTAMSVIGDFLRVAEPAVVIWVAYSEELCEQATDEFETMWRYTGNRQIPLHRFWGNHEINPHELSDGLIVAGLPKLSKRMGDIGFINGLSKKCRLLVIDEAHQAIAPTYETVLTALTVQATGVALLGLTATPGRTWNDVSADEKLAEFFARRKVSLRIPGYANPIDYLVNNGYLAKAEFKSLLHGGKNTLTDADLAKVTQSLDIPEHVLEQLAKDEIRNLAILTEIEALAKRHKRIIVFAASVNHAHLLAAVLVAKNYKASAITTRTPSSERGRLIQEYKIDSGDTRIICNYGVLTTGFDAPLTSCAVIARPTSSLVLYSQMVGRAIRGPKAGGNTSAEIVTVVDRQLPGFGTVSDAFTNWEDIWN